MPKTPAEIVHETLGVRPLARALCRTPGTIAKWKVNGLVPAKYQRKIIELADGAITADDLIHGRP